MTQSNSFNARQTLTVGAKTYTYFSLAEAEKHGLKGISSLPFSMRVLLENLLRYEDGRTVTRADIEAVAAWVQNRGRVEKEIAFRPARVLMQDFTGVPAVVDLAAMRDAMKKLGGDPRAELRWVDIRGGTGLKGLDFVVMNPPFHDGGAEDQSLGQAFIRRAAEALRPGGALWLVANRHLPYEAVLKSAFKRVTPKVEASGYKIYEAVK